MGPVLLRWPRHCGRSTTGSRGGKHHWEGGKGCRDKARMSNKDRAKFRGTNKTSSVSKTSGQHKKQKKHQRTTPTLHTK